MTNARHLTPHRGPALQASVVLPATRLYAPLERTTGFSFGYNVAAYNEPGGAWVCLAVTGHACSRYGHAWGTI